MKTVPLPPSIATALPTIRWPLSGPSSCPPLYFESLESMKAIRAKSSSSLSNLELAEDLPGTMEKLLPNEDDERRQFGLVSMALILLGHGYTDEAHDIVTPLSWPDDIHFGYGPSVYSQVSSSPVCSFATYVHCLVHRREAFNVGELGMVGFANANYWSNAVLRSAAVDALPHDDIRKHVLELAQSTQYSNEAAIQDWCQTHNELLVNNQKTGKDSHYYWDPRVVHELCANALRAASNGKDNVTPQLVSFAERVAETELRILLFHALKHAGYDCDMTSVLEREESTSSSGGSSAMPVDETIALAAANKVSSAHLESFQTSNSITLRNVVSTSAREEDNNDDKMKALSAAAGVAARLLGVFACRRLTLPTISSLKEEQMAIRIGLPITWEQAEAVQKEGGRNNSNGGGPPSPGDVVAMLVVGPEKTAQQGDDITSLDKDGPWYFFVPCDSKDKDAIFVDRLYEARGVTPTTVIQWSKGTIF